ncbi:MAG: hypothetical protein WC412_02400 [Candidatus Omnitrophota bacterium]|jgi:hypothetical protein
MNPAPLKIHYGYLSRECIEFFKMKRLVDVLAVFKQQLSKNVKGGAE